MKIAPGEGPPLILQCTSCWEVKGRLEPDGLFAWIDRCECGGRVERRHKIRIHLDGAKYAADASPRRETLVCELCERGRLVHQFERWPKRSGPPFITRPLVCAECLLDHAYTMRRPQGWSEQVDEITRRSVQCAEAVYSALKKEIARCRMTSPPTRRGRPRTSRTG